MLLLAAMLVMASGGCRMGEIREGVAEGKRELAEGYLENLMQMVESHHITHRRLPASLEAFAVVDPTTGEVLVDRVDVDPWGHAYGYQRLGPASYRVWSVGPDGLRGTEDDIVRGRIRR